MKTAAQFSVSLATIMILIIGCSSTSSISDIQTGQHPQTFKTKVTKVIDAEYLVYLPKQYTEDKKPWPTILFLHGAGERGNDLELVKEHGPPQIVEEKEDFPFIVISPQCPEDERWSTEVLNTLLDEVIKKYRIDEDRIYLTGLSMGGFGTWALAVEYPDRFAAIAPICGGGMAWRAYRIKHLPVWVFHGAQDKTVPIKNSQDMVDALKKHGGNVKFTIYPEAGHDSWTETYNNPELYEWFMKQRRQKNKK